MFLPEIFQTKCWKIGGLGERKSVGGRLRQESPSATPRIMNWACVIMHVMRTGGQTLSHIRLLFPPIFRVSVHRVVFHVGSRKPRTEFLEWMMIHSIPCLPLMQTAAPHQHVLEFKNFEFMNDRHIILYFLSHVCRHHYVVVYDLSFYFFRY